MLGAMQCTGQGGTRDLQGAWHEKTTVPPTVLEMCDEAALSDEDGRYYDLAEASQDYVEARRLYGLAAAQGHAVSQLLIPFPHPTQHSLTEGVVTLYELPPPRSVARSCPRRLRRM